MNDSAPSPSAVSMLCVSSRIVHKCHRVMFMVGVGTIDSRARDAC
jgi:hypothetical protein